MAFGGLSNIKGLEGLSGFDALGFLSGVGKFLVIILLFGAAAGILYWWLTTKKNKVLNNKKIFWFEEVNGNMTAVDEDVASELTIPGTNINVFYIKRKDMYLPRPVKRMGKDAYWFCIRNNREIVNFKMKNLNKEMSESNLDFDHTDMRYALTNLKELIKRNYRDKATVWWREYKDVIAIVIFVFVLTLSFFFIISKVGTLIDKIGVLIDHADQLIKLAETKASSGIVIK
ncbi:hypothetical protein LCGC14_2172310 [marine sediment metagenome]|uniref:Uncharacterized protein n=1 Tax=marine sediment metagenome TaxID=412755 RepID=A0A0F9EBV6_9ZZZZ